jgi:hypothetical protein
MLSPNTKRNITSLRTVLIALGTLLSIASVASGQSKRFDITGAQDPKIVVISTRDRTAYDTTVETSLAYTVAIKGRCAEKWRLKSAKVKRIDGTAEFLKVDTDNRSISPDHGQASTFISIISTYVKPDLTTYSKFFAPVAQPTSPPKACNAELDRLVKEGSSRAKLLQDGFELIAFKSHQAELEVWCQDDHVIKEADRRYRDTTEIHTRIRCEGTGYRPPQRTPVPDRPAPPPPPQRTPPPPPPLTSVSVAASPAETKGKACPVYVNFSGRILANPDSKYSTFNTKYRFLGDGNYKTDWVFVSINKGETRTVHGRRFIQAPANDPGGTLVGAGGKPKIPLFNGWMALEVALPNGAKRSERENFVVDCNPVPPKPKIKGVG